MPCFQIPKGGGGGGGKGNAHERGPAGRGLQSVLSCGCSNREFFLDISLGGGCRGTLMVLSRYFPAFPAESTALHGCGRGRDVAIWLRKKLRFSEAANWLLLTCYRTWTQRRQLDWNCECQDEAGSPAAPTDHHQVWRRWSGCCWVPNVPGAGPRGCPEAEGQH